MKSRQRSYGECPECGHQCFTDSSDGVEPNIVRRHSHRYTNTDYGRGEDWLEDYLCPECGTKFTEANGYP